MTLRQSSGQARAEKAELLREIGSERILVKDGPYGSMIQSYRLDEEGFRAGRSFNHDQKGNNDLLNLTRPDVVGEICKSYIDAGADILATNTFNSNAISLSDYGIAGMTREINLAAAKLTRACADAATAKNPDKPRFVVGALGPTNKTLSVSPNVNDPGYRAVSFDEMKGQYRAQNNSPDRWARVTAANVASAASVCLAPGQAAHLSLKSIVGPYRAACAPARCGEEDASGAPPAGE